MATRRGFLFTAAGALMGAASAGLNAILPGERGAAAESGGAEAFISLPAAPGTTFPESETALIPSDYAWPMEARVELIADHEAGTWQAWGHPTFSEPSTGWWAGSVEGAPLS